ncbi:MAG: hypothetical protein RLZZ387_2870 [Chloroflexota bacterium]|jgi:inosine-uridine nucleoside N-ribohydrolase
MTTAPVFVDTDVGVDDAVAIAWLLRAAKVIGFTTVFGNSSVEDATSNLLTLLHAAGFCHLPVAVGAAAPLVGARPRITTLIHGVDGFWGAQGSYDLVRLPHDAPSAIAAAARTYPAMTLVALGPLTNVALAVERFPADLAGVRVVALGGAWRGGNMTPVAEFNIYADPHALERVLAAGLRLELVTLDAFDRVVVDPEPFAQALAERCGPAGELLASMLPPYFGAVASLDGVPSLPDVAAVVYALNPDLGTASPALVRVVTERCYAYGQTIFGFAPAERLRLVASDEELNALVEAAGGLDLEAAVREIEQGARDNALVVCDVDGAAMAELLCTVLYAERVT